MKTYNSLKTDFFNKIFSKKVQAMSNGTREEFHYFLHILQPQKKNTFIELGAGNGRYVLPLLRLGYAVTAVDVAPVALKSLQKVAKQQKIDKRLHTLVGDFTKKPNTKFQNKYDIGYLVATFYMLSEKQEERIKIFKNFLQTIKKNGKVLILDPNPLCPLLYPYYWFYPGVDWQVEKNFLSSNRWNMVHILQLLGLKNVRVIQYGFFPGRLMDRFPFVKYLNMFFYKIPLLNYFSSFTFFYAEKK